MISLTRWTCASPPRFAAPFTLLLLASLLLASAANSADAQGLDRIRLRNGVQTGKITQMTPLGLTLTKGGVDNKVAVEEIVTITFAGEPGNLAPARRDARAGRLESALEKLKKIDLSDVPRKEVQQEIEFLTASCNAQLALAGNGNLDTARKQVASFLSKNNKSFHVPAAIEMRGDLLLAGQDYRGARAQYAKLAKAPAPYFKTRSAILTGLSLQLEGKHKEAVAAFDQAMASATGNSVAQPQQLEATLLRAVSQSALGDIGPSTETVKKIIQQADAQNTSLLAQAYNALGDCYLQAKEKKAARQAYLHVDLLFSASANEHAKALHQLSQLWDDLGQSARARDARERLSKQYPGSRWAKK